MLKHGNFLRQTLAVLGLAIFTLHARVPAYADQPNGDCLVNTSVWAWGANWYGQIGDGTTDDKLTPVPTSGLANIVAISAGDDHSLALSADGTVWAWGANYAGQLGDGTTQDKLTPTPVDGSNLSDVVAVAAGFAHSLALTSDGTVWAWGSNFSGQLGDGTTEIKLTPTPTVGLSNVIAITTGSSHSLALRGDGTVWAWGSNKAGQLGDGTTHDSSVPIPVDDTDLRGVIAITAGSRHSLALLTDGTVWAWGSNRDGELGVPRTNVKEGSLELTPVQTTDLSDVVAISAGREHSLALRDDGTVWAWGSNRFGQLGDGTTHGISDVPVQTAGLSQMVAVAAGGLHSLAVRADGVWAWGLNNSGQLGDGTTEVSSVPVQTSDLGDVAAISAGDSHSLALKLEPTIEQLFDNLVDEIDALDDLPQARGLLATLERSAVIALDKDQPEVAVKLLDGFINQVEALIRSGKLTAEDGDDLIVYAETLIDILISLSEL